MKRHCLYLGSGSFVLYALLPTQQYAGDGLRWLATITGPWPPTLGGTNHLLYPTFAWLWYHAGASLLPNISPLQIIQLLSATTAAAGIAIFAKVLGQLGASRSAVWVSAVLLIFARAYSGIATNIVEVMPSMPLILLALSLLLSQAGRPPATWRRCVLAGAALALATSVYQASAFSLPALLAAIWWHPTATRFARQRGIIWTAGAFTVGAVVLYLVSFRTIGNIATWPEALRLGLQTESPSAFGSLDPRHLAGSMFGWVVSWLGLFDFQGISYLLRDNAKGSAIANLALVALHYGLWLCFAVGVWRRRGVSEDQRRALKIAAVWFLPPFLFTAYWLPAYEKLWLSPLAATIAAFAVLLTASRSRVSKSAAIALCGFTVALNLVFWLAPSHFTPNVYAADVSAAAERISVQDLVITDGWGPSAAYYQFLSGKSSLAYAGVALASPRDSAAAIAYVARHIEETRSGGGAVYFLGLLDLDAADWRPLFGERFGIDFGVLEPYRATAAPVMQLSEKTLNGHSLHLWRLP